MGMYGIDPEETADALDDHAEWDAAQLMRDLNVRLNRAESVIARVKEYALSRCNNDYMNVASASWIVHLAETYGQQDSSDPEVVEGASKEDSTSPENGVRISFYLDGEDPAVHTLPSVPKEGEGLHFNEKHYLVVGVQWNLTHYHPNGTDVDVIADSTANLSS